MEQKKVAQQTLSWWIVVFVSIVVIFHSLLQLGIVLFWHAAIPFSGWDLLLAIVGSEVVAILAGAVTIVISWKMTQRFGEESTSSITMEVRQAMGTTLSDQESYIQILDEILDEGSNDPHSIVVASLSETVMEESRELGEALARLLNADREAIIAVPVPQWIYDGQAATATTRPFWAAICKIATETEFLERFATRKTILVPVEPEHARDAACLLRSEAKDQFRVMIATQGFFTTDAIDGFIGAVSKVDEAWGNGVLDHLCDILQEPASSYADRMIQPDDIFKGKYCGLGTTRSIVTTQLILGCDAVLRITPTTGGMRTMSVSLPDGSEGQFEYSPEQFLPPALLSGDHSGSLLGQVFWKSEIDLNGQVVLEIGCGPGYVTTIMSTKCGDGRIIAIDRSKRALVIAKANVDRNGRPSHVTLVKADANHLKFKESASGNGISVTNDAGDNIADNVRTVLIDLPLLPYTGKRVLTKLEKPYLEASESTGGKILPATIRYLLSCLANLLCGDETQVLLPVCASDEQELVKVEEEIRTECTGCQLERVSRDIGGYVSCLRIVCESTPE